MSAKNKIQTKMNLRQSFGVHTFGNQDGYLAPVGVAKLGNIIVFRLGQKANLGVYVFARYNFGYNLRRVPPRQKCPFKRNA